MKAGFRGVEVDMSVVGGGVVLRDTRDFKFQAEAIFIALGQASVLPLPIFEW